METLGLKTLYVLFFVEHVTRRVHLAGCTAHPDNAWVTQQARQMTWELEGREPPIRYLIHDNDTKFTESFDRVFRSEGIEIVHTPYQAHNANAIAERWVRMVREECLNKLLVLNEQHLRRVMDEYVTHHNRPLPHQGIEQQTPIPSPTAQTDGSVQRREMMGGSYTSTFGKLLGPILGTDRVFWDYAQHKGTNLGHIVPNGRDACPMTAGHVEVYGRETTTSCLQGRRH